ncbi:hypothetical protein GJ496_007753, partial [Pomphorhynchus laevis]
MGKGGKGLEKGGVKGQGRRLAKLGGVKRISGLIYEKTRNVMKSLLESVIGDAVADRTQEPKAKNRHRDRCGLFSEQTKPHS